jgi:sugar phosphate isomerase/epimerase
VFKCLGPAHIDLQLPWPEVHDLAARHGFQGVELTTGVLDAPAEERRQVAADLDARGVRAGGFSLPMRFDRDEAEYAAGLADLPRRAAAAAELGSRWCSAHVWPGSDELDLDANLEFHAERLRPVAETLLLSGIRFGIEFIGTPSLRRPNRHEFIHTLPGALALGARIGTPNVGLLMDTWHLFTSGGTPADMRSLRGEQVVHAHVNDAPAGVAQDELIDTERLLPGASGVIDARAFLTVLDEIGFDGPTLVEPFNAEVRALPPEERVAAVAASLESVWP